MFAVALLGGVGLVASHEAGRAVNTDAQARVGSNRDAAVRALVRQADDFKRSTATFAMNAPIIDGLRSPTPTRLAEVQDQLSTLARSKHSPAAFVSDLQGHNIAVYPAQPELVGQDFSYRDWFKGVSRTGSAYVSTTFQTAVVGQPLVVAVSAPVADGPRRVGYITLLWQLASVRSVIDGSRRDDGVNITVSDQDGQSMTDVVKVDTRGEPLAGPVPDTTRLALAGQSVDALREDTFVAAGPVPGLGWTVTAERPASLALASGRTFRTSLKVTLVAALFLVLGFTLLAWRLSRRRVAEQVALTESEERFRRVFDEALTGTFLVSRHGNILRTNGTADSLLGAEPHELVGRSMTGLFEDPADQRRIAEIVRAGVGELRNEMALRSVDGRHLWGLVVVRWMTERERQRVILVQVEDVTARRAAEEKLTELALHDDLTGLPNRRLLLERCEHAFSVARSGRLGSTSVSALFIDLDGFKPVNDRAGHDTGDQLLVAIAHDLQAALRPTDTLARVGGDEFVVLLEQNDDLTYLRALADRVTRVVKRQHVISDGTALTVTASVGIARIDLAHEPDANPDQLLRHADTAMYYAKERGRNRHEVFDADLRERTDARQVLAQTVREGLLHDRISLVFQPVVDVDRNVVVGAEALMRLRNADGRLMPSLPAVIAAEAAGLAGALGDRVLDLALDAARTWPANMSLAVNISARELTGTDLRSRVERALLRYSFDPARLILEITESSILGAGPSAFTELERLRQRGVRVAIDDFGTAYATLQNLTTLPVDVLKVDASFTRGLPHRRAHTAIVHGVVSIASELGIPCIIEGVETNEQLVALHGMSVQAQGWLWGQPQGPGRVPMVNDQEWDHLTSS